MGSLHWHPDSFVSTFGSSGLQPGHECAPSDTCVCILGPSHTPPWAWTSCWECLRHRRVTFRSLLTLSFRGDACDTRPPLTRAVRAEARPCPVRSQKPRRGPGVGGPAERGSGRLCWLLSFLWEPQDVPLYRDVGRMIRTCLGVVCAEDPFCLPGLSSTAPPPGAPRGRPHKACSAPRGRRPCPHRPAGGCLAFRWRPPKPCPGRRRLPGARRPGGCLLIPGRSLR